MRHRLRNGSVPTGSVGASAQFQEGADELCLLIRGIVRHCLLNSSLCRRVIAADNRASRLDNVLVLFFATPDECRNCHGEGELHHNRVFFHRVFLV